MSYVRIGNTKVVTVCSEVKRNPTTSGEVKGINIQRTIRYIW